LPDFIGTKKQVSGQQRAGEARDTHSSEYPLFLGFFLFARLCNLFILPVGLLLTLDVCGRRRFVGVSMMGLALLSRFFMQRDVAVLSELRCARSRWSVRLVILEYLRHGRGAREEEKKVAPFGETNVAVIVFVHGSVKILELFGRDLDT
jgi:hypothetical protein